MAQLAAHRSYEPMVQGSSPCRSSFYFECEIQKIVTEVGFEPTPPKRLVPKTSALDHSAIQTLQVTIKNIIIVYFNML